MDKAPSIHNLSLIIKTVFMERKLCLKLALFPLVSRYLHMLQQSSLDVKLFSNSHAKIYEGIIFALQRMAKNKPVE